MTTIPALSAKVCKLLLVNFNFMKSTRCLKGVWATTKGQSVCVCVKILMKQLQSKKEKKHGCGDANFWAFWYRYKRCINVTG